MATTLAEAIASVEGRFGTHVLARGAAVERRSAERRIETGTSLDALRPVLASGAPLAFIGPGGAGATTLAHRAVAGAQRDGGAVLWVDPSATFDPLAAVRAGVDLARLIVVRAQTRDGVLLAAGAALRSDGFRLAVVDTGPRFAAVQHVGIDDLAPLLAIVRSSPAALLVVSETRPVRVAIPTLAFARVAWERRFGRTTGWVSSVGERAVFHFDALGRELHDVGMRTGSTASTGSLERTG